LNFVEGKERKESAAGTEVLCLDITLHVQCVVELQSSEVMGNLQPFAFIVSR